MMKKTNKILVYAMSLIMVMGATFTPVLPTLATGESQGDIANEVFQEVTDLTIQPKTFDDLVAIQQTLAYGESVTLMDTQMGPFSRSGGGVDKIEIAWWGIRISISAETMRGVLNTGIDAGVTIAGVFIPGFILDQVVWMLDLGVSFITRGIWFEVSVLGLVGIGGIVNAGLQ